MKTDLSTAPRSGSPESEVYEPFIFSYGIREYYITLKRIVTQEHGTEWFWHISYCQEEEEEGDNEQYSFRTIQTLNANIFSREQAIEAFKSNLKWHSTLAVCS